MKKKMTSSAGLGVPAEVSYALSGQLHDVLGMETALVGTVTWPDGASGSMYTAKTSLATLVA